MTFSSLDSPSLRHSVIAECSNAKIASGVNFTVLHLVSLAYIRIRGNNRLGSCFCNRGSGLFRSTASRITARSRSRSRGLVRQSSALASINVNTAAFLLLELITTIGTFGPRRFIWLNRRRRGFIERRERLAGCCLCAHPPEILFFRGEPLMPRECAQELIVERVFR